MDPAQPNTPPHDWPGLSPDEVEASRARHGANELTPPTREPWYKLYLEKFNDPIIRILLVAAVIALGVGAMDGHYAEGVGILIAIFLATTLSFFNEFKAGQEFDLLNRVTDDVPVRVRRGGENTTVPRRALVVDDIILLENGEEVPADAEVLEAVSVLVNESSLTGESMPVAKYPRGDDPEDIARKKNGQVGSGIVGTAVTETSRHSYPTHQLLRGTLLADGHAVARIQAVGDASEIGRTARAAAEETETTTPLKKQLEKLSKVIGVVGFAMAGLVFAVLVAQGARKNTLGAKILVSAVDADHADVTVHAVWVDGNPTDIRIESNDTVFPAIEDVGRFADVVFGDALPSAGIWRFGNLVLHRDGETPIADADKPTVFNMDIARRPLAASEWYCFAILVVGGLLAMFPIWWPIVLDAREMIARRRPALPAWMAGPGWRMWLISLGAGLATVAVMIGVGRAVGVLDTTPGDWLALATAESFLKIFMIAVTIIVVAVPEGLPMSVTLSLAYAMRKMTATNNLVRKMHACETIGAATVICSDKTGTLTENKMRVAETLFSGVPNQPDTPDYHPDPFLGEAIAVNATADLGLGDPGPDGRRQPVVLGNPTEGALLLWMNVDKKGRYDKLRDGFGTEQQLPFSTENKFMATSGRSGAAGGVPVLFVKGAPEIVLGLCQAERSAFFKAPATPPRGWKFVLPEHPPDMAEDRRAAWLEAIRGRQARGMRALGFAFRRLDDADLEKPPEELCHDLIWMGFCAIADPVRAEVPAAIDACRTAGIQVKVVTGDNADTAREIARGIGLWQPDDGPERITTGEVFSELDDEAVIGVSENIKIMARARPLAKLRLVKTLQEQGEVVAVTGDGTNDAPALNHADVGLAMGQTGTSTAKEAADIILLDDSFQSIVNAVRWGRSLYSNIQKFILFQLTINVAALGVAVLGPFLGVGSPLTVTQMLWVNLIMDTFATLALATEPPNDAVMRVPPRSPSAFIVTPPMRKMIFGMGGAIVAAFIGLVAFGGSVFPLTPEHPEGLRNLSVFFNAFVFVQFWNLFNARAFQTGRSALARLGESKAFLAIAALIVVGQVAITEFGGALFRLTPLTLGEWGGIVGGTSLVLWIGEIMRWRARAADATPRPDAAKA